MPWAACLLGGVGGFSAAHRGAGVRVEFPAELLEKVPVGLREALLGILGGDPRPAYHRDPGRVYGMPFGGIEVKFTVAGDVLTVRGIEKV